MEIDFFEAAFFALDFLELAFFMLAVFALPFFALAFFAVFFFDAAFFDVTFFDEDFLAVALPDFLAVFFLEAGFFLPAFLDDDFLAEDFLAEDFFFVAFFVTFLREAAFFFGAFLLLAGFLRAIVFFFDDFFAATFFLLTLDFLPAVFLLEPDFALAADFREAFTGLRFLLAVFFAGISYSCRSEKNAQLYIASSDMEGLIIGFEVVFQLWLPGTARSRIFGPTGWRFPPVSTCNPSRLSFTGDNRFIAEIALHYLESFWRWANTTKCD